MQTASSYIKTGRRWPRRNRDRRGGEHTVLAPASVLYVSGKGPALYYAGLILVCPFRSTVFAPLDLPRHGYVQKEKNGLHACISRYVKTEKNIYNNK